MPDFHIHRPHTLGLERARKITRKWIASAEKQYDVTCTVTEGETSDRVQFKRSGFSGAVNVSAEHFAIDCKLGILYGAFKNKIEEEVARQLDTALAKEAAKVAKA